jgi:hypothetical protein
MLFDDLIALGINLTQKQRDDYFCMSFQLVSLRGSSISATFSSMHATEIMQVTFPFPQRLTMLLNSTSKV